MEVRKYKNGMRFTGPMTKFEQDVLKEQQKEDMESKGFKSFHYLENGEIVTSMYDTIKTLKKMEPGSYKISWLDHPENRVQVVQDRDLETAKIHNFADKERLDALYDAFFDPKVVEKMKKLNFYHKVGVLLHGREGTGKTTIIKHYYSRAIEEHGALVFHLEAAYRVSDLWNFVASIRKVQSNPIIVVLEEIDSFLFDNKGAFIKKFLDGNLSIDNCMFFASTNYLDSLPTPLTERPSRFKYVLDVQGINDTDDVKGIVTWMLGDVFDTKEIDRMAKDLVGEPLDVIKQFCLDKIMDIKTYEKKEKKKIGFT